MRWFRRSTPPKVPLRVRPMRPEDGAHLDAVFAGMSARSRYFRFHAPMAALSPAARAALLAIDGRAHVAFVAEACDGDEWRAIGISRFVETGPGEAELAVEVVDAWHGRGIGRLLLEALRERARALGFRELHAAVLTDNTPVLTLLHGVFPGARLVAGGRDGTVVCPLQPSGLVRASDAWADAFAATP